MATFPLDRVTASSSFARESGFQARDSTSFEGSKAWMILHLCNLSPEAFRRSSKITPVLVAVASKSRS